MQIELSAINRFGLLEPFASGAKAQNCYREKPLDLDCASASASASVFFRLVVANANANFNFISSVA